MPLSHHKHIIDAVSHSDSYQSCIRKPAYFVAPNGSDTQDGSFERPWRSLEKACANLKAGDHLYLREGIYYEALNLEKSGTAQKPISISNYPEEHAVISGAKLPKATNNNNVLTLLNIQDQEHIRIAGLQFQDLETHDAKQMAIAIFIHGAAQNIYLGNNRISNIRSLAATGDAHGIAIYGTNPNKAIRQITLNSNHLSNLKLGSSEALAINGNIEYFVVSNNRIHDCDNIGIDIIGYEGKSSNKANDFARHGIIRRNLVYNIDTLNNSSYNFERNAAGIYVDGGSDISIYDNIVHHSNIGIELASEHAGHATELIRLEHNLLYHNHIAGLALGGYDKYRGKTTHCHIKHNHLIENDSDLSGNGELWLQHFVENNTIEHNTFRPNQQQLFIACDVNNSQDNHINHNNFHKPKTLKADSGANGQWIWQGKSYTDFSNYRSKTNNDSESTLQPYEDVLANLS